MRELKRRLSPSMIVASVALFMALGGGAYAAVNQIDGGNLKDQSVSASKIKDKAIGWHKISDSLANALKRHARDGRNGTNGKNGATGPQGPQGPQGPPGQNGVGGGGGGGGFNNPGGSGQQTSQPRVITNFGQNLGVDTFMAADYGDNSQTPEPCAPNGRGGDPANVPNGVVAFGTPPAAPPLGNQSLHMLTLLGKPVVAYLPQDGCDSHKELSQLTDASYSSYVNSRDPSDASKATDVSFQVEITGGNTGTASGYTTMVYEPYQNGTQGKSGWNIHNVVTGKVWSTHSLTSGDCTQAAPCPFSTFQAHNLTAKVIDVKFRVGQNSGTGYVGLDTWVDDVTLGYGYAVRYDLGG